MLWNVARKVYDGALEEVDKAQAEGLEPCSQGAGGQPREAAKTSLQQGGPA